MQTQADLLVGDTFLSAACIAYSGAFTGPYRATLVAGWIARCQELGIPTSPTCMLRTSLAPAAQVQLGSWDSSDTNTPRYTQITEDVCCKSMKICGKART